MNKLSVILLNAFPEKKTKTLGNKGLVDISRNKKIIDYHISFFHKLSNNTDIIIVDGYDSKKMKKYLKQKKYLEDSRIKYVCHNIDDGMNIGTSLVEAIDILSDTTDRILIHNTSLLYNKLFVKNMKKYILNNSFCFIQNCKVGSEIGCLIDNNKIMSCYYGLPNRMVDTLFIDNKDTDKFINIIKTYPPKIRNMFLFEIINICIDMGIQYSAINIRKKDLSSIKKIRV